MSSVPSKAKAMKALTEYEAAECCVHVTITVKKKKIDGKTMVLGCIGDMSPFQTGAIQEEYSDMDKLLAAAAEIVKAKAKAI